MRPEGIHLHYRFEGDDAPAGESGATALDHPLYRLLDALAREGSVQHAAPALGISYRHLWGSLRQWEERLGEPLVLWVRGQPARLTESARQRLDAQRMACARVAAQVDAIRQELAAAMDLQAPGAAPVLRLHGPYDPALLGLRAAAAAHAGGPVLRLQAKPAEEAMNTLARGGCEAAAWSEAVQAEPPPPGAALPERQAQPDAVELAAWTLLPCLRRSVGLMLAPGDTHTLAALASAQARRLRFVGSETGPQAAGVLGRARLGLHGMQASDPEPTPLAAATAVALGRADLAIGWQAVAEPLGLQFLPLETEDLWIVCRTEGTEPAAQRSLSALLRSADWRRRVVEMPGCSPHPGAGQPRPGQPHSTPTPTPTHPPTPALARARVRE